MNVTKHIGLTKVDVFIINVFPIDEIIQLPSFKIIKDRLLNYLQKEKLNFLLLGKISREDICDACLRFGCSRLILLKFTNIYFLVDIDMVELLQVINYIYRIENLKVFW